MIKRIKTCTKIYDLCNSECFFNQKTCIHGKKTVPLQPHFEFGNQAKTIITKEYSKTWEKGDEPYYPVNNDRNNHLYKSYKKLADEQGNVIFGGRLGHYRYYDMHQVIGAALQCVRNELD